MDKDQKQEEKKEIVKMKQGGVSWNNSTNSKKGINSRYKCSICGRSYKQEFQKDRHEKQCKELNKK